MELRSKIKEAILSMETPFCIADLLEMLPKKGIVANNNLVLEVLDELYDYRLIDYRQQSSTMDKPRWAFFVV